MANSPVMKTICAIICLSIICLISGCRPNTVSPRHPVSQTPTPPNSHTPQVTLRFSVLGAKQETDLANALVKGFEKKHPNIKINVEPVAGMGYDIKLVMQSAAGTVPDIVFLADSLVPTFTKYRVVRDLNEFIKPDKEFPINDIYPQMMRTGMDKEGRVFQLPRELGVVVMFYNRTLFRRAGLPDPPPNWTHKDFLEMAKKLTLRDKQGRVTQYGFMASYNWCGVFAPWIASEGGRVVSKDGKRAEFSSPASLRGLHNLIDLVTVYDVALPPNRNLTVPGVDPFAAGKVAMIPQVFPQVPFYRATMKDFDWDMQVMPAGSVRHVTNMGAAGYGMASNTKHPKEAWEFLKFIVSEEGQRILAASGSGIPVLKSLAKDSCWRGPASTEVPSSNQQALNKQVPSSKSQVPKAETGNPKPGTVSQIINHKPLTIPKQPSTILNYDAFVDSVKIGMGWDDFLILTRPEVSDAVTQAFEKSFLKQATLEQAFKEADTKINKILAEEERK